jgi:hypothetical protein
MDGNVERKQLDKPSLVVFLGERSNIHLLETTHRWSMEAAPTCNPTIQIVFLGERAQNTNTNTNSLQTHITLASMDGNLERKQPSMLPNPSRPSPGACSEYKYKYEFITDPHYLGASVDGEPGRRERTKEAQSSRPSLGGRSE